MYVQAGLGSDDALVVRQACIALTQLAPLPDNLNPNSLQPIYQALVNILLGSRLQDATWFTAAEAAVPAIYALHPAPQEVARAVLRRLAKVALGQHQSTGQRCNQTNQPGTNSCPEVPADLPLTPHVAGALPHYDCCTCYSTA